MATLVRFLPHADKPAIEEAIYFGLVSWLEQGEKLDAAILLAVKDKLPARRTLAGLLVGRFGNEDQKASARKLLEDIDVTVRLRTAKGFLGAMDKSGVSTLIDLLNKTPPAIAWQAEELLRFAAGDAPPKAVIGKATRHRHGVDWPGNTGGKNRSQGSIWPQSRKQTVVRD